MTDKEFKERFEPSPMSRGALKYYKREYYKRKRMVDPQAMNIGEDQYLIGKNFESKCSGTP